MKINNIFRFTFIFIFITLFSCEQKSDAEIVKEYGIQINIQRRAFGDFKGLSDLYNETVTLEQEKFSKKPSSSQIEIDPTSVTQAVVEGNTFYTFKVTSHKSDHTFQNLTIADYADDRQSEAFLMTYRPDLAYFERHTDDPFTYFTGNKSIEPLDFDKVMTARGSCFTVTEFSCDYGGEVHSAGANCTQVFTRSYTFCPPAAPSGDDEALLAPPSGGGNGNDGRTDGQGLTREQVENLDIMTQPLSQINLHIYLINKIGYSYNDSRSRWLMNTENKKAMIEIVAFLEENGYSTTAKAAVERALTFLRAGYDVVSFAPLVKYPKGSNYANKYKKLTEYLKNQLPKVADLPKITNAINKFTKLPISRIKKELQWGDGPTLEIVQLDNYKQGETDDDTVGYFDKTKPDKILLDIDFVNLVENETADPDALIFWIGTTVLHEYVHYGDHASGFEYLGEEGRLFEIEVYGENVQPDRARLILNRLNN